MKPVKLQRLGAANQCANVFLIYVAWGSVSTSGKTRLPWTLRKLLTEGQSAKRFIKKASTGKKLNDSTRSLSRRCTFEIVSGDNPKKKTAFQTRRCRRNCHRYQKVDLRFRRHKYLSIAAVFLSLSIMAPTSLRILFCFKYCSILSFTWSYATRVSGILSKTLIK